MGAVRIVTIGRGRIGAGLAALWRRAGHDVTELGRDGGDATDADVLLVAVPSGRIVEALRAVTGLDGKVAIDATNPLPEREGDWSSHAEAVRSVTHGPVAKAFNLNFGALYDRVAEQRVRPSDLFAADADARDVVERLIRDAGFDPVHVGDMTKARALEDAVPIWTGVQPAGGTFHRFAIPGEL